GDITVSHYTSIAIGSDGMPILLHFDTKLYVLRCANVQCNSQFPAGGGIIESSVGQYPSMTIGTDGLPIVSYYDTSHQHLKIAHCSDPDCSSSTKTTIDSAGDSGSFTSIAIGSDGLPIISYQGATSFSSLRQLKVAHCANVQCSSATIETIEQD